MLWCVCLFNYADRQAINSVFKPLAAEFKLSKVELSFIGSAFMYVYAVMLPFAGLVGDRFNRKTLILGGLGFWSVVTLLTGFAESYWQLIVCRALEGLGEAFYFPASMSLICDYHGKATRSRAMALHQSSVYFGTILGGTFAGFCAEEYGWRSGFYIFGGLGVALAFLLAFFLKEPVRGACDDDPEATTATPRDLIRGVPLLMQNKSLLIILAVFIGTVFVGSIFLTWMPTYLGENFNMSLTMAGLTATIWMQLASVLGTLTGGWLADRWVKTDVTGRVKVQALGLVLGAPLVFAAGWTLDINVLIVMLVGFGFCKGMYDSNTWAVLYDVVPKERRSTALGLVNGLGWLIGGAPAPTVIALMAGVIGFGASLSMTSGVYLTCGLMMIWLAMRLRQASTR
ncbi:MFS transporter [soil metagenome]